MENNENISSQLAASIASAGTPEYKPVETPAPSEGNQEKPADKGESAPATPAPEPGQPAEENKSSEPSESKAEPTESSSVAEKPSNPIEKEEKQEKSEPDDDSLIREALGIKSEPDTPESLKSKYEASSKEAHRLVEEAKAKAEALAEAGVEFVLTKDGKFALKANDKYLDTFKDTDLPDVYGKLSEEDQGLVTKEVAAKIVKQALAEALPKRPVAKATSNDATISETDIQKVFDSMSGEKMPNGQPRFADINEDSTVKYMRELYDRPAAESFRNWMNQSTDNFREGLSMLHAQVFRVRAPLLAAKKNAEAAKKADEDKLKKKPATVASGSGTTPDAMRHKGTPNGGNDPASIAKMIASAQHR